MTSEEVPMPHAPTNAERKFIDQYGGLPPEPPTIRARVLALQTDRKPVPLDVPEWGEDIYIRVLSANDQALLAETTDQNTMPVRVILACLVDVDGQRIFDDGDEAALGDFPFPEIMTVFAKVAKLNGLSTAELEEAVARFTTAPDEFNSSE